MSEKYDVIVVGGGAAGMMAAARAAARGKKVLLLDKNPKLGKKLAITGGGRCNILNAEPDEKKLLSHYGDAEQFLYSAFAQFGMQDAYDFFEANNLPLKVEARSRAFPVVEKATEVVATLQKLLTEKNVTIRLKSSVTKINQSNGKIDSVEVGKATYIADSYILATGGFSRPETGSTGDAFPWLTALGHTFRKPTPTIVPLKTKEAWSKQLAGMSVPGAKITYFVEGQRRFSVTGQILFTHAGLSGPTILNSSGKVADLLQEGGVHAEIDLFPAADIGTLDKLLVELFDENKNKSLKNVFRTFVPAGTSTVLLSLLPAIDPETKVHSLTKEERRQIVLLVKTLPLTITGLMGFDKAVVADGGVPLKEIDTRTMRSKKVENLFIIGDLLDISRPSGGYSLQLCWTTGQVAGAHA